MSDPTDAPLPVPAGADPGIMVWDKQVNRPAYIPTADYDAAIRGGRYKSYDQTTITTDRAGYDTTTTPEQGLDNMRLGGEAFVSPRTAEEAAVSATRTAAYDNWGDKATTFLEGITSAMTLGVVKERGAEASTRRDELGGWAAGGEIAALATAFINPTAAGPLLGRLAASSTALGKQVGVNAIRTAAAEASGGAVGRGIARRALSEGVENSAFTLAYGAGNAAVDAVLEDKPFASEHVAAAAAQDLVVGGAFGAVLGGLGGMFRGARSTLKAREWITAQGGVLDAASAESLKINQTVGDAIGGWDEALDKHRALSEQLDPALKGGELGAGGAQWSADRRAAVSAATKLRAKLGQIDIGKALASDDVAVHQALLGYKNTKGVFIPGLLDQYGDAVSKLDGYAPMAGSDDWLAMRDRYAGISAQAEEAEAVLARETGIPSTAPTNDRNVYSVYDQGIKNAIDGAGPSGTLAGVGPGQSPTPGAVPRQADEGTRVIRGSAREAQPPARSADEIANELEQIELNGYGQKPGVKVAQTGLPPQKGKGTRVITDDVEAPAARAAESARAVTDAPAGRDLNAPNIDPATSKSQLAGFARDIQKLAQSIDNPTIDNLWHAMNEAGGKAPKIKKVGNGTPEVTWTPERIREVIAEAEHAGYLKTGGARTYEVPHMGM